jgi:hypothetical protein
MTDVHGIRVTGGSFPAAIWKRFMDVAVPARSGGAVVTPADGAVPPAAQREVTICVDSFMIATPLCPNTVTVPLDESSLPPGPCTLDH